MSEADPDIFVSYSRQHERLVTPLVKLLMVGGRLVFQDVGSINLGSKWDDSIVDSLNKSKTVIVIWCDHAKLSKWVQKEAQLAVSAEKAIIPVRIDKTPLPDFLVRYQGVDLSEHIKHTHTLAEKLKAHKIITCSILIFILMFNIVLIGVLVGVLLMEPRMSLSPNIGPPRMRESERIKYEIEHTENEIERIKSSRDAVDNPILAERLKELHREVDRLKEEYSRAVEEETAAQELRRKEAEARRIEEAKAAEKQRIAEEELFYRKLYIAVISSVTLATAMGLALHKHRRRRRRQADHLAELVMMEVEKIPR